MKALRIGMACLLLVSVTSCQSIQWIFKPAQVVCDNQEVANNVKTKAKNVLDKALFVMDTLEAEWILAINPEVRLMLTVAITAAQGVISGAYHLTYEVICPNLEQLGLIQKQEEEMQFQAARAIMRARIVRMGVE